MTRGAAPVPPPALFPRPSGPDFALMREAHMHRATPQASPRRRRRALLLAATALAALAVLAAGCGKKDDASAGGSTPGGGRSLAGSVNLVAYSTPQEAYEKIQAEFRKSDAARALTFKNSFGASGDQSRAVDG